MLGRDAAEKAGGGDEEGSDLDHCGGGLECLVGGFKCEVLKGCCFVGE